MIVTIAGGAFTFSPNDDELAGINLEFAAFDGEIGNGQFPMPDPSAAATMTTGRQFKVVEGSALLTDGLIIDNDRQRGPFRVGTQREYGVSVQDANALLDGFRIFRHRTAETDYARVMAFAAADGPAWDTTWVLNANTVTMPVKLYDSDGGWTSELIPDLIDFTGKTLFLHDKAIGGRCLHYHNLTSGHTCGLTISDVVGALSATCFAPQDPMRQRTSVDLRNDILARDQTGRTATATDSSSITTHDADGLQHQALLSLEANSQADLQLQTNAYLASFKDDRDTWTCAIGPLDDTALGLIRVGDLITVTSAVMGLTASPQRIAHMRQRPAGVAPGKWMAELELGAPIRRRARVRNKAITDRIQHLPIPDAATGSCQHLTFSGWTVTEDIETGFISTEDLSAGTITTIPLQPSNADVNLGGSIQTARVLDSPAPFDSSNKVHIRGSMYWPGVSADSLDGPWANETPGGIGANGTIQIGAQIGLLDGVTGFAYLLLEVNAGRGSGGGFDPSVYDEVIKLNGDSTDTVAWDSTVAAWYQYHIFIDATNIRANVWSTGSEPAGYTLNATHSTTDLTEFRFRGYVFQTGQNGDPLSNTGPKPPELKEAEYRFAITVPVVCTGDELPQAWHGFPYVVSLGNGDGSSTDFVLPDYPPDPIASVRALLNGNYEPSTYDAATRTVTFATPPAAIDTIDVEILPQ